MRVAGIICECNPLHDGHLHLIREARRGGAEVIVCVMSGCFTQRGEAAIAEPLSRAEALLHGGADVVLELPFPYSSSGAEFFASAGVSILARLGVGELWFGSESGSLDALWRMAEQVLTEEFQRSYAERSRTCAGTAQSFFELLSEQTGTPIEARPNDILALSYLRAIRSQGREMKLYAVLRKGSGFHEDTLQADVIPSASALRKRFLENGLESICPYLPAVTASSLRKAVECGRAPATLTHAQAWILGYFRTAGTEELNGIAELGGGLGNRLAQKAAEADSLSGLLEMSATKKYPISRISRGILFALTGVTREDLRREPAYARLLGANAEGRAFLAGRRREGEIPILTKQSELPKNADAERQDALHQRALSLYGLCLPMPIAPATLLRQKPILL